jgi:dishevelled associated activator of morphogenesis
MDTQIGLSAVLDSDGALDVIALSLRSPSVRTRALVLEIFGAVCLIPGGHQCVLEGMDAMADVCGLRSRFEIVVYSLWQSCQGLMPLDKELQVMNPQHRGECIF